ncbi:MAG: TonB-dependent receptor [Ignavibacteria bacterium]|nr:TonB-dependent receptor [Ignavibacteria bacterium]
MTYLKEILSKFDGIIAIFFLVAILLPYENLYSQEEEEDTLKYQIEELVITGSRYMKKIIDIPYSVYRVDVKELNFGRKISAKDVLADVPGLFLQSRFGNHDIRISLRGYGTRSSSGIRGVRILHDGIPVTETDGETVIDVVDFTSLGGVEVVKGNMSFLYSSSPGGVINFLSDFSFNESFITSTNQAGKFGFRQNGFKAGVKTDHFRAFISYSYRNIFGYRKHSEEYTHLLNSLFQGYLGTRTSFDILINYVNGLNRLPGSLTETEFNSDPFKAQDLAVSQDYRRITAKGQGGIRIKTFWGKAENNELEFTLYGGVKDLEKTDDTYYTISTRYSLGGYLRFTNKSYLDVHYNEFTIGIDAANQNGPLTEFNNINGKKDLTIQNQYQNVSNNVGVYFQDQLSIFPDKMDIYIAGRYDIIKYSKTALQFNGMIDTTRLFAKFTPKVALNYKLLPSLSVYTSYSLGFDAPILSELENITRVGPLLTPNLEPAKSYNYELGVKGNFINKESEIMRKVFFEITLFNYRIIDDIIPYTINNATYFRTASKTNRFGIEFGLMTEPLDRVELTVNYVFTNFKYIDYTTNVITPSGTFFYNFSDNYMPSFPQHILNIIFNYEWYITKNLNGLLQFDCDYISKMFVDDANSKSTNGYFYANPLFGINIYYNKLNFLAYIGINNIFDKRYVGYININDYWGRYYNVGEPRNIYGGLNIKYSL